MVKAAGDNWAWWNQYGSVPLEKCVQRAKAAGIGVVTKAGWGVPREAFIAAGVRWATEAYVYPVVAEAQAELLAGEIAKGAEFAVINAEVEWTRQPRDPMERLIARFRALQPGAELYASVDTRGGRNRLPYQRVLAEHVAGWMPMIYPKTFSPGTPAGFVERAFRVSLDGATFRQPVLPTIQTYNGIGAVAVRAQVAEVHRRGLPGCQAYTICHATDEEWAAFVGATKEDDMIQIVTEKGDWLTRAWVFDGRTRYWWRDPVSLGQLQDAGVLPAAKVVPAGSLDDIPIVEPSEG